MKRLLFLQVTLLLLLALSDDVKGNGENDGQCKCGKDLALKPRPHSVSILEFGAVGDGKTLNTIAFQNAVFYLRSFADKGGAQLYVPPGRWLTGSFNLTSHLTLFLERNAVILGTQDSFEWQVIDPLPSYGRGIELPGGRHRSLINGYKLKDVVITGDNGTIDGQGSIWWEWYHSQSLNYSRPHLVELESSTDVVISNLTFLNAPAWSIHPVYCSNVHIQNITVYTPSNSPGTNGIVPDSSSDICIEDCYVSVGGDAISLKSGWDEYGIAYGKPTSNVYISRVYLQTSFGSALAFGSEMSGGISNVCAEQLHIRDSFTGIELKTARGRGGFVKDVGVSDVEMENIHVALGITGQCSDHPDDHFDPNAYPDISGITLKNVIGANISVAGELKGIPEDPFTSICLLNISLSMTSELSTSWVCSDVLGFSRSVSPEPCSDLQLPYSNSSSVCFSLLSPAGHAEAF
ncbi:putative polygalacturonase [Cinnamomum micranthum f. kanehirae]|uniref:Putative polygalacturonase n=1 Tax=Cinnamomum micranthum f. kanehirae TaxID=337451 RepID=A0A3S3PMY1_9MAGN|nr:putative polygalacturonase [Cinnamomum micranthum f. kanehirae]